MAVFYKIQKNNNSKSSTNGKYYARAFALQTINTAGLITEIEKLCTVTDADVQAVITALVFVMNQKLQDGYRVKIDNFGAFKIGLKSKPAENLNDFSAAKHIVGSRVNFLPETHWSAADGNRRHRQFLTGLKVQLLDKTGDSSDSEGDDQDNG